MLQLVLVDLSMNANLSSAGINQDQDPRGMLSIACSASGRIFEKATDLNFGDQSIESGSRFADLRSKFVTKLTTSWEQEEWRTNPPKVDWEIVATQKQTTKRLSEREKSENYLKFVYIILLLTYSGTLY